MLDFNTKNQSFLITAKMLKEMGVKNYAFFLELKDPTLQGIDPTSTTLDTITKVKVIKEITTNFWYYIREVVYIHDASVPTKFSLNLGNLAMFWCLMNSFCFLLILPRQSFKTYSIATWYSWLLLYGGKNSNIIAFGHSASLLKNNIGRVSSIITSLPKYLQRDNKKNKNNSEEILIYRTSDDKNSFKTKAPGNSEETAGNVGRGFSTACQWYDEIAFINNISFHYEAASHAFYTAANTAKQRGDYASIAMTTTAGYLNHDSGKWAYEFIKRSADFNIELYDYIKVDSNGNAKFDKYRIEDYLKNNSENKQFFHIEYNYRALGQDDNYLLERLQGATGIGGMDSFMREVLNVWVETDSKHPLGQNRVIKLKKNVIEPSSTIIIDDIYFLKLYGITEKDLINNSYKYVCGMDCSGNLGGDFTTFVVSDITNRHVVAVMRMNQFNTTRFGNAIAYILINLLPKSVLVGERNSMGVAVLDNISNKMNNAKSRIYYDENNKIGVNMDKNLRPMFFNDILRIAVVENGEHIYDKNIIDEIASLKTLSNGRIDHSGKGSHDDTLMGYLYTMWFIMRCKKRDYYYDASLFNSKLNESDEYNLYNEFKFIYNSEDLNYANRIKDDISRINNKNIGNIEMNNDDKYGFRDKHFDDYFSSQNDNSEDEYIAEDGMNYFREMVNNRNNGNTNINDVNVLTTDENIEVEDNPDKNEPDTIKREIIDGLMKKKKDEYEKKDSSFFEF